MASIEGYHVNKEQKCKDFLNKETALIISVDQEYLGRGMYFWDNKANAKYWFKQQRRKHPCDSLMAVSCNLSLEKLLDLTDGDIRRVVDKAWHTIQNRAENDGVPLKMGARLDYIRRFHPLIKTLNIYKMLAQYENDEHKYNFGSPYLACNVRTIYCVKDPEAIISEPIDCTKEVVP